MREAGSCTAGVPACTFNVSARPSSAALPSLRPSRLPPLSGAGWQGRLSDRMPEGDNCEVRREN
jgi:hypothetical protein